MTNLRTTGVDDFMAIVGVLVPEDDGMLGIRGTRGVEETVAAKDVVAVASNTEFKRKKKGI